MNLSQFFQQHAIHQAAQIYPYVARPSNPVTGAAIPQHPTQPTSPPAPKVVL